MTPDHLQRQAEPRSAWRTLARSFAPHASRGQVITGLLCALLGFALVVQVQANRREGLSSLRQDELVRILDEVTRRAEELQTQVTDLRAQRTELVTGSDTERAAREAAAARAEVQGILAGELPAVGPGVELIIRQPDQQIPAPVLYNVLEELRNAGAEAIQVGDQRLTASSYFIDTPSAVQVVQRGPSAGARFLLDAERTVAGRSPNADIFLDDVTVSRKHVEFVREGGGFVVRDVGSLNGTYVNRDRIERAPLRAGDEVQIGKFRMTFHPSPVHPADRPEGVAVRRVNRAGVEGHCLL